MNRMGAPTHIDLDFTMAFQPIVDVGAGGSIFAYEALVRGPVGQGADGVFAGVSPADLNAFDEACRSRAIGIAASLGLPSRLSLNVSATAICDRRHGLHTTLRRANELGWPINNLIFEMTEHHPVADPGKLGRWIAAARKRDVKIAIDDFGAGYAGLSSLLTLRPEIIKLDLALVRHIDTDRSRQALVKGIVDACHSFSCIVIAEGVETDPEFSMLRKLGVTLMQGFLFAMPGLGHLPTINWPISITVDEPQRYPAGAMVDHDGAYQ